MSCAATVQQRSGATRADERAERERIDNVRPVDWRNPSPVRRYDLVIVGAGTAGLVAAEAAASRGAKVALVERHLLGGLMVKTALEAFTLGTRQAQDRCPRALVDHFQPHVGERSIFSAGTNPACLVPHRSVPFRRAGDARSGCWPA